jgi:hypothetical protein
MTSSPSPTKVYTYTLPLSLPPNATLSLLTGFFSAATYSSSSWLDGLTSPEREGLHAELEVLLTRLEELVLVTRDQERDVRAYDFVLGVPLGEINSENAVLRRLEYVHGYVEVLLERVHGSLPRDRQPCGAAFAYLRTLPPEGGVLLATRLIIHSLDSLLEKNGDWSALDPEEAEALNNAVMWPELKQGRRFDARVGSYVACLPHSLTGWRRREEEERQKNRDRERLEVLNRRIAALEL